MSYVSKRTQTISFLELKSSVIIPVTFPSLAENTLFQYLMALSCKKTNKKKTFLSYKALCFSHAEFSFLKKISVSHLTGEDGRQLILSLNKF